jgi:AraC-like DNA-binding protein
MTKSFQKSANTLRELQLPHPGIIHSEDFATHFELHCYAPSPELRPFVAHIWTQHPKQPLDPSYTPPIEIVSGPSAYLFFTSESAFVHSPAQQVFHYNPLDSDVIAGIKFRPGGLYPFLRRSMSELDIAIPIPLLAKADAAFRERLLSQSDSMIVSMIEDLLRSHDPKADKNLSLIAKITDALASDNSLQTVSATAKAFGISERSLQLLFQTHVGVGVKWIITRRRLLKAIDYAQRQPHLSWAEVAAELGYSSQSHFSRDFREVTRLTPSEYLRSIAASTQHKRHIHS